MLLSTLVTLLACAPAQAQAFNVAPFLQTATPTDIWIVWETTTGSDTTVEWGPTSALGETTTGSSNTSSAGYPIHEVQLTGLTPDTTYYYRAKTGSLTGTIQSFHTPPAAESEASFRMVAMSDMQKDYANPDKFEEIVEEGVIDFLDTEVGGKLAEALGLVLVPGDLVDYGWYYSEFADDFFGPASNLISQVPVYPVYGNHEADTLYYQEYFHLPDNGTAGYEEHWYSTDYSNVRVIGLDSNSGYRIQTQLDWLEGLLADTCDEEHIDFVFAQLHHPHLSELWLDGETDFTGDVITLLENFTSECGKPSIHFFGHTHGYSRGQSQDHEHLWVNVATAGGNIDYWGEYAQADYDEFTVSQAEWGFVLLDVEAGDDPKFRMRRISRGDEYEPLDNEVRDDVTIRRHNTAPTTPTGTFPTGTEVDPDCFMLEANDFSDDDGDAHGATQWQVSASCDDFSSPIIDRWIQHQNWYFGEDTQAGDDLTDEEVSTLQPETAYCWRARYRDQSLGWSDWSEPMAFETTASAYSDNLVLNGDAESGTDHWTVNTGYFESLAAGECGGIEPYAGDYYFGVGALCQEAEYAEAEQDVDISAWADEVDSGAATAMIDVMLANWSGYDQPAVWLVYVNGDGEEVGQSSVLTDATATWTAFQLNAPIPSTTRTLRVMLSGTFYSGVDTDAYVDDLSVRLNTSGASECQGGDEMSSDTSDTSDTAPPAAGDDTGMPKGSEDEDSAPCGCAVGGLPGVAIAGVALLLASARRRRSDNVRA